MNENEKSRSGLQTAVDFAHAARAAKRIMQAAAASGVHGAAAATAREAFPLLLKVLIAVLVVFIAVPMVIFTALPNIFFGYNSSGTDTVIQMTQQAMTLGGVYMTLGNFEGAQIDSVVTGIAAEYEKNGTTIDHIVVSSAMTDDDLLWVIAINSAAHQQDLNTMSADLIRDFCKSSLSYTPSLSFMDSGDDGVVTTLRIEVKHLDPEKLMDELGFDSEARQWAGALYETLEESDAINKYKSYYEAYQPGYGGDGSYSGDVEYGSGYDNEIDISGFVDPSTKNNLDLAAYAIQAWANNWGYVWGTYGNVLTPALFEYKKQQYPDGVGNYADFIKEHWLGRRTADCIGLIKGYGWLDTKSMTKISQLIIWFALKKKDLSEEDKSRLDSSLVEVYGRYGITFDNSSIVDENGDFRTMPIISDWYDVLSQNPDTRYLSVVLSRYVTGSAAAMASRNSIDLDNKYIVLDLSGMPDDMIADGTFWATSIAYDLIMSCESDLSALLADELWSLVGATANPQAAGFVLEMVKTIRGLGGIAVTSTQGMQDLFGLDGGSYGKGILDASRIKLVMQMEEQEARLIQDKLNLSEDEVRQITRFRRGEGLLCIGYNHVPVAFHTTPKEYEAITTSPTDLRRGRSEYGDE